MEKIYAKLEELNIIEEQLPKELQNIIDGLDERIEALNEEIEDLESKGATEEEIDEQTSEEDGELEDLENQIVATIESYYANNRRAYSNQSVPTNISGKNVIIRGDKDKKGGDGWFLLGAFALVVTLGAVNLFKK